MSEPTDHGGAPPDESESNRRTRHDNLQIACRFTNQLKEHDFMDVRTMPDGSIRWANKWGGVKFVKPAMKVRTTTYPENAPF